MAGPPREERLASWFSEQFPDAQKVYIEGLDKVEMGHSAETLLLTVVADELRLDVAVRVRPPAPGLLEPYDMGRQFDILRAVETSPVRAPRALWFEPTGEVLGREFYVMEQLPGIVYERSVPDDLKNDPDRVRRMCESVTEQIAAIHMVDLSGGELSGIDGGDYLDRELLHWSSEVERVQTVPFPALELLATVLRDQQPAPCPNITLVHGDPKPGNFAFVGAEVSAVFDWELATVGDPLADIAWAEVLWTMPSSFPALDGAMSADEFVARWENLTGIASRHRGWYRAFQSYKMAVILLVGGHIYGAGYSDDIRLLEMTYGIAPMTARALAELGVEDRPEPGPVIPERRSESRP